MKPIINSIIDQDVYKLSMGMGVLELFPNVIVSYKFKNRGSQRFNKEFIEELKEQIKMMSTLALTEQEYLWIKKNIPYLKPCYLEFLKNYRFNPSEININLTEDNNLELEINGPWISTIYWEVPLLATISELYFKIVDTNWTIDMEKQGVLAAKKIGQMAANDIFFSEFGTRRRRSFDVQDIVIRTFVECNELTKNLRSYVGTSNVYFAMKYGYKPMGTCAHEWTMGISVLEGLRNANYYALQNWTRVYNGSLGIALTDTYGLDSFLNNFNMRFARLFDGVRHDSGDPYLFIDKIINHYTKMNIDPLTKTIIFSDSLNIDKAIEIKKYCKGKIKCSFGIGTFLTNDFQNSPALNMVIKLSGVVYNNRYVPVVKLSDCEGKEMGDDNAVKVAKWTFFGTALNNCL